MSPEIFIDDLYDTFRDNDNPEEFDDQISDFDENLNQPEETRSVSVIVATSPQSSLASPQPSPVSLAPGMCICVDKNEDFYFDSKELLQNQA